MSFGWSVGDIGMAISLVVKIYNALDNVSGAAGEYRETVSFLRNLNYTLDKLLNLSENGDKLRYAAEIREQVECMKPRVGDFLEHINTKYNADLSQTSSKRVHSIASKLIWAVSTSSKAKVLQAGIQRNIQNIERLIQLEIHASVQNDLPEQLRSCFSGIEAHLDSTMEGNIQPLRTDFLQALELHRDDIVGTIQSRDAEFTTALRILEEKIQNLSREPSPQPPACENPFISPAEKQLYTATTILSNASSITSKYQRTGFEKQTSQAQRLLLPDPVLKRLESWLRTPASEVLWVQEAPHGNSSSSIGASLVVAGQQPSVPVIAYSCQWDIDNDIGDISPMKRMIYLTTSIIHQLTNHLPQTITTDIDFSIGRFADISEERAESLVSAVDLIEDLLIISPEKIVFVLDGLQKFDHITDALVVETAQNLLKVLRAVKQQRILKTLLTTPGQSLLLNQETQIAERLNAAAMARVASRTNPSLMLVKSLNSISTGQGSMKDEID